MICTSHIWRHPYIHITFSIYTYNVIHIYIWRHPYTHMTSSYELDKFLGGSPKFFMGGSPNFSWGVPPKFFMGGSPKFFMGAHQKIFTKYTCHVTNGDVIPLEGPPMLLRVAPPFEGSRVLTHALHCTRLHASPCQLGTLLSARKYRHTLAPRMTHPIHCLPPAVSMYRFLRPELALPFTTRVDHLIPISFKNNF